jgi:hypothetical protein
MGIKGIFQQEAVKNWCNYALSLLYMVLLAAIVYLSGKLYVQSRALKNLNSMSNYLIDSVLPLSNLLTKSAGNMHNYKHDYTMHVHPTLFYQQQDNSHRLDFVLLKPSYSLIDCLGEVVEEAKYPLKMSFTWQPSSQDANQYQLICERHDKFNNISGYSANNNASNEHHVQKKVLLTEVNQVKFKFFESLTNINGEPIVRLIDPNELQTDHNKQLSAVQIGMLLQSEQPLLITEKSQKYHIFQEQYKFFDRFLHKVIYITLKSNVT